jgi:hypothetical protein
VSRSGPWPGAKQIVDHAYSIQLIARDYERVLTVRATLRVYLAVYIQVEVGAVVSYALLECYSFGRGQRCGEFNLQWKCVKLIYFAIYEHSLILNIEIHCALKLGRHKIDYLVECDVYVVLSLDNLFKEPFVGLVTR